MRFGVDGARRWSFAAGALVLAFGAIVLARAHSAAGRPAASAPPGGRAEGPARIAVRTPELNGFVAFTQSALLADGVRELFAEVRLEADGAAGSGARRPVALAVALDTSGSMSGDKIVQARRAVDALLERMQPGDRVALVTYDHGARLLTPLTPVSDARARLSSIVREIQAGGGTNIPAGLELGARALADAPPSMVRRLVLVSDGQDGSGLALETVSRTLLDRAAGGVTTSSLGVGVDYDERWLSTVADAGRGNYAFLAGGGELARFLARELEQASTTVADRTELALHLPSGWRVADSYGAAVPAGTGTVPLGALFAGERRRVTLRLEVPAGAVGEAAEVGVDLRYRATALESDRNLSLGRLSVAMVSDEATVAGSRDLALHAEAVAAHVDARQALAIEAWRGGRRDEAERIARGNVVTLQRWQQQAPAAAAELEGRIEAVQLDLDNIGRFDARSRRGRAYGLESNAARRSRLEAF